MKVLGVGRFRHSRVLGDERFLEGQGLRICRFGLE